MARAGIAVDSAVACPDPGRRFMPRCSPHRFLTQGKTLAGECDHEVDALSFGHATNRRHERAN